jgi:hypothetical protein
MNDNAAEIIVLFVILAFALAFCGEPDLVDAIASGISGEPIETFVD